VTTYKSNWPRRIKERQTPIKLPVVDPVQQKAQGPLAIGAPLGTFEGINQAGGCGNCIPPDPTGDVGPNHYVEAVNSSFAVYSKTGTVLAGPSEINDLFSTLPGNPPCKQLNDGDPIVLHDQLSDRWLISQFTAGPDYHECIAISKTSNPTGAYHVYDFDVGGTSVFHDYPKFGVWPDGYYMTSNQFEGATGAGVFAFERDKMLAGQPARFVYFDLSTVNSSYGGMLPSDLDGWNLPPEGAPNYFAEIDSEINTPSLGPDAMRIWEFRVDWANPTNSKFGLDGEPNAILPVAMWNPPQCIRGVGTCPPQLGSPYTLDVLGDRLMFRLVYRNFGTHESLVANHSVVADARIGVRWYEVRSPGSSPTIHQQSTFAPTDALYRWMGSIAMDNDGNIAAGYSTSSAATFPSLAYAGRLATDPVNAFGQGEAQLWAGTGAQNVGLYLPPASRWGDYTHLSVDPTDDCTFWYVNQYYGTEGTTNPGAPWRTRIGSFKFSQCTPVVNPSPVPTVQTGANANPVFAGLAQVLDTQQCDRLTLNWAPATSINPNADIAYDIFRVSSVAQGNGTEAPTFAPSTGNRIANDVTATSFTDTGLQRNQTYYYIVQARDRNNGRLDTNNLGNAVARWSAPTSPNASSALFPIENFETAAANNRFTPPLQESATPNQALAVFQRVPHANFGGSGMYAPDFNPAENPGTGDGGPSDFSAVMGPFTLTADSVMEFDSFFFTEGSFDGGVIELAIGAPNFNSTPFPDNTSTFDLGNHMIQNGYNGKLDGTIEGAAYLSALQGRRAFTGSRSISKTRISLRAFAGGPFNPNNSPVYIRFRMTSDIGTSGGPQSGWYIDNVAINNIADCPLTTCAAPTNVALASSGATAVASSSHSSGSYPASAVINGDSIGNNWGTSSGGWNDGTRAAYPDSLEVTFAGARMIDEIAVVTLQNGWQTATTAPDENTLATAEGILDFVVEYWDGAAWVAIPNGSVTGNDRALRRFTFTAVTTTKIRVVITNSRNNWSRLVEVEAWGCPP
jgi:hypothetical protein